MISRELSGFSTHIMLAIGAPLICLLCSSPSSIVASSRAYSSVLTVLTLGLLCTSAVLTVLTLGLLCTSAVLTVLTLGLLCTSAVYTDCINTRVTVYICCIY